MSEAFTELSLKERMGILNYHLAQAEIRSGIAMDSGFNVHRLIDKHTGRILALRVYNGPVFTDFIRGKVEGDDIERAGAGQTDSAGQAPLALRTMGCADDSE